MAILTSDPLEIATGMGRGKGIKYMKTATDFITAANTLFRTSVILLILLTGCATTPRIGNSAVVLVKATIESIGEAISVGTSGRDAVDIGVPFQVRIGSVRPFIGHLSQRTVNLKMVSLPRIRKPPEIFILGVEMTDGTVSVLYLEYAVNGLCIGRDLSKTLAIEDDVRRIVKARKVAWNDNCNWHPLAASDSK